MPQYIFNLILATVGPYVGYAILMGVVAYLFRGQISAVVRGLKFRSGEPAIDDATYFAAIKTIHARAIHDECPEGLAAVKTLMEHFWKHPPAVNESEVSP